MPWFHVDDGFHSHPKVLATSLEARGLWVTAGSWSSDHLTDGVVPDRVLASLGGTPELAKELVTAGLWTRRARSHVFHDWDGNGNQTKQAVENDRRKAAERQRRSRAGRASRRDTTVSHGVSPPVSSGAPGVRDTVGVTSTPAADGRASPQAGRAATAKSRSKPPWCGVCDKDTRLTGPADEPYRCPACHPLSPRRTP